MSKLTAAIFVFVGLAGAWTLFSSFGNKTAAAKPRRRIDTRVWLNQAGLNEVSPSEFVGVAGAVAFACGLGGYLLFGGLISPITCALFGLTLPIAGFRLRREKRRQEAQQHWPRMIEEIRVLATSAGKSIPAALFEVGRRGPQELQAGFQAAEREWHLSTDFSRATQVLKRELSDPTADSVCETLLVAHQIGGGDLAQRLSRLAADRQADVQHRNDARAKQSGVRFARRFVVVVPLGMALVGLSIGNGRAAYQTSGGQFGVLIGLLSLAACWIWAGTLLRIPKEERVLNG